MCGQTNTDKHTRRLLEDVFGCRAGRVAASSSLWPPRSSGWAKLRHPRPQREGVARQELPAAAFVWGVCELYSARTSTASAILCREVQVFVSLSVISAFPKIRHKNLPCFCSYQSNTLQHPMWMMTVSSQLRGGRERQGKALLQEVREPGGVTCAQDTSKLPLLCCQTCWGSKSRE